ncbi:MAG: hypothetical protein L0Z50_17175, partial [Verrucomicrobiales bacterium]|nr:hypothetical protein [Verrucomicrobiales bacterium]
MLVLNASSPGASAAGLDAFHANLLPPELVFRHAAEIGLTAGQRQALERELGALRDAALPLAERLQRESKALAELTAPDKPDEAAVQAQLDKLLEIEREVKRALLAMTLRAKAHLTPEQQARLLSLKRAAGESPTVTDAQARVAAKLNRVKQVTQRWKQQGRDLTHVRGYWSKVESLTQSGQWEEAERMLDKAL